LITAGATHDQLNVFERRELSRLASFDEIPRM
jgi:hypothetical protein